jgi:hypothetical protein
MPLPTVPAGASKKERQQIASEVIREIMASWAKTHKINGDPVATREEAQKRAVAIAMSHVGLSDRKKAEMSSEVVEPIAGWPAENIAVFAVNDGEMASLEERGETVLKFGFLFAAGDYADKQFSLTPAELLAAAAAFQPVEADFGHIEGTANGHMGRLVAVQASDDGSELYGLFEEPKSYPVSLGWDRAKKTILGIAARTGKPRIADAAVFGDDDKPKENAMAEKEVETPKGVKAGMRALFDQATPEELAQLDAIFAESKPVPVKTPREKELEDRIAKFEQDQATAAAAAVQAQAVAFADSLVTAGKIAAQGNDAYNEAVAMFTLCADYDAKRPQLACFSDEAAAKKFNALPVLTAYVKLMPNLGLDGEKAGGADQETARLIAAFEQEVTTVNGKAADQAVDWAEVNKSRAERGLKPVEAK